MKIRLALLTCKQCDEKQKWDAAGRLRALQKAGHLRKVTDPKSPLVDELFTSQVSSLPCPSCKQAGYLHLTWIDPQEQADSEDDDWGGRLCKSCRQPIPAERLQVIPNATLCVACQQTEVCASNCSTLSDESCPKCGNWLHIETRRSSLRTHILRCPACNYRSE